MLFPCLTVRPLLCTSLLLNGHRCWGFLKAPWLYMKIRQADMTNLDLSGSDNLDQADVQRAGRPVDQICQQLLSHGASLTIFFATNICLFACLVYTLIRNGFTLCMGRREHPSSITGQAGTPIQHYWWKSFLIRYVSLGILVSQTSFRMELCLQNCTRCSTQCDRPSLWISGFSILQWCTILQRTHVG